MSLNPFRNAFKERVIEVTTGAGLFRADSPPYHYKPEEIADYYAAYLNYDIIRAPIDDLTEMAAGHGYFTEIDNDGTDGRNPRARAKKTCDEFGRFHSLDQMLPNIVRNMLIAGFLPVETIINGTNPKKTALKIVHPLTVTKIKSERGIVSEITQEVNNEKNVIKGENLAWFVYTQIANDPRGTSFVRGLITILNTLNDATSDVDRILKRYIGPIAIWKTREEIDAIKEAVIHRDPGEDMFLGGMRQEDVENPNMPQMITIDPRVPYWEYIEYLDRRIYASTRASNLYYIRNATQASAKEMEKIVMRHVGAIQRDVKRTVEKYWFEPLVGLPTPKIKFGKEQTGVEDIDPSLFLQKGVDAGLIQKDQYYDILKQMGLDVTAPTGATTPPQKTGAEPKTQTTPPEARDIDQEIYTEMVANRNPQYNAVYDVANLMRFHARNMEIPYPTLVDIAIKYCLRYGVSDEKRVIAKVAALLELEGYSLIDAPSHIKDAING